MGILLRPVELYYIEAKIGADTHKLAYLNGVCIFQGEKAREVALAMREALSAYNHPQRIIALPLSQEDLAKAMDVDDPTLPFGFNDEAVMAAAKLRIAKERLRGSEPSEL